MKSSQPAVKKKRYLDWEAIHQRITMISERLTHAEETDIETMEAVWKERAAQLAQTLDQDKPEERVELILVRIGSEVYGLDARIVTGIRPLENITRVPRTPPWLAGVVNVRGRVLAVLHLQKLFNLPTPENIPASSYLVVVETQQNEAALVVQDVLDIKSYPVSQIQAGDTIRRINPEYVKGIVSRGDSSNTMLIFLNITAILNDKQLIIREEIL